jgi:REP element-mobilizing transposase RayT
MTNHVHLLIQADEAAGITVVRPAVLLTMRVLAIPRRSGLYSKVLFLRPLIVFVVF